MYTLGITTQHETYHPDTIYDEDGNAVCLVYGIASNMVMSRLDERDAKGLALAKKIVEALNKIEAEQLAK